MHATIKLMPHPHQNVEELKQDFIDAFRTLKPVEVEPLTFALSGKLSKRAFNTFKHNHEGVGAIYTPVKGGV